MGLAIDLLARGYFPRELPPPFTTRPFARWAKNAGSPSQWTATKERTRFAVHNQSRAGTLRRKLALPHPFQQAIIADLIEQNWQNVVNAVTMAPLSQTIPTLARSPQRALLPGKGLEMLPELRATSRVGG